jgi:hypothetical protein
VAVSAASSIYLFCCNGQRTTAGTGKEKRKVLSKLGRMYEHVASEHLPRLMVSNVACMGSSDGVLIWCLRVQRDILQAGGWNWVAQWVGYGSWTVCLTDRHGVSLGMSICLHV